MQQREIKFRAWNAQRRKMLVGQDTINFTVAHLNLPSFNWMQYTGLKDKNGKEIYEGDILRKAGIVTWNQVELRWSCIDIEWNDQREWHDLLYLTTPLEIIGNIYESPHLLKPVA